jgi:serine/threonine protein kinase
MNACPSAERLRQLLDEDLLSPEDRRLERHVELCLECQAKLDVLTSSDSDSFRPPSQKQDFRDFLIRLGKSPPTSPPTGTVTESIRLPAVSGYEIFGEVGRGGMGVIYKARQISLDRLVALKVILIGTHASSEHLERFRREAKAIARLDHPHVVKVFDVGECEGRPFYAMEYITGGNLAQYLAGVPQNASVCADTVEKLARAIQTAHDQGVVHRDLKPANVLLTISPRRINDVADATRSLDSMAPKISDFGLAKIIADRSTIRETRTGAVMGSPSYMAPEQAQGIIDDIGLSVDIYALGAILYEMLTGRPPFRAATSVETIVQVVHDEPVTPSRFQPKIPRDLEVICLKCLQKKPGERYARAADLADDLLRFRNGEPIRARPVAPWRQIVRWARRRPAVAALIFVTVVATASLLAGAVAYNTRLQTEFDHTRQQQERAAEHLSTAIDVLEHQLDEIRAAAERGQPLPAAAAKSMVDYALPFYERLLIDVDQSNPMARRAAGRAYSGLARTNRMAGRWDQADIGFQRAVALQESLVADAADHVPYRLDLAHTLRDFHGLLSSQNQATEAKAALTRMVELIQDLSPHEPRVGVLASYVAQDLFNQGKLREALPWLERHTKEMEIQFARAEPGQVREFIRSTLNAMYVAKAELLETLGEDSAALAAWDLAISLRIPASATFGGIYSRTHRAAIHYRMGKFGAFLEDLYAVMREAISSYKSSKK